MEYWKSSLQLHVDYSEERFPLYRQRSHLVNSLSGKQGEAHFIVY